jgi:hypothetical protein
MWTLNRVAKSFPQKSGFAAKSLQFGILLENILIFALLSIKQCNAVQGL